MSFAIETKELSFSYGRERKVVDKLSLQVPQGSIYGFLGPNGAGKTTTIRLLTGMLLSEQDNVFIRQQSLHKNIPAIFRSMGTLIETPSLYLHLTAKENLRVITTLRSLPESRIDEVLTLVGLNQVTNRKVRAFSLGMKQRLGIAMALLPDPDLLILDEPANGLDPQGIIEIRELLKRLNAEQGKTIFVSSHLLHEVEKTCTHIGIIHNGKLRYQGGLGQLKTEAQASGEVLFDVPGARTWIEKIKAAYPTAQMVNDNEIIFSFSENEHVSGINRYLVEMNVPVTGIQVKGGLEDWFIRLTQKDNQII